MAVIDRENLVKPFIWSVIIAGLGVSLSAAYRLDYHGLDATYIALVVITILIGSRISVRIPHVQGEVTISDTLIFLSLLLYGGEPAILLATAEAFLTSLRFSKKMMTHCFNAAVMACSCFLTASTLRFCFGEIAGLRFWPVSGKLLTALYVMALVQYFSNSSLIAVYNGLKSGQPIWQTWNKYYLYTSATCLASASAAGLIVRLISLVSIYAFLAVVPILAVVYFTYWSYLKQVEAKSLQIEQAGKHVAELQESEARFRSAFDNAAIGMALVDPLGHWLQVNRSLCEITGFAEAELLASNYQAITHRDDLGAALIQMHQLLEGRTPAFHLEKRYVHALGHTVWVLWSVSMARDVATKSDRLIFQIQDITDRKRAEEQLLHDAFHDGLTGLPNRALFIDHLKMVIERNKRHKERQYAVLFLDFDRFKVINDSLGHVVGDQLLIAIARRLENCLRPGDTIARLGGDEFTILLDEIKSVSEAVEVAERIQKSLEQAFILNGHEIFTTVSIGIANSSLSYEKPEDMLRDADTAMYRAKNRGTSHHEVFDKAMHSQAMSRLHLENDLRKAIERDEFILHYQPIVALEDGRLQGFEALVRWQHPEHGLVSPAQFIPVSEETGLIVPLGHWVMREACRQMREWQFADPATARLQMSVNLSSKQFVQPDLLGQIKAVLHETGLAPRCLKLEITESVVMENIETAISLLQEIRALGIELSIDDFGTGYSSLSYLHRFPLSTLKIDRSFVMQMGVQDENTEIVRTIIMLASNLNMDVVAEGIETAEQLAALRWLECKYGQGYYFSRPVDARAATELVRTHKQWEVMQATLLFMNQKASVGRYSS
jgi:diguanylate cyclase (GGDEF)-like protein/PAS domain S-box-containing protein